MKNAFERKTYLLIFILFLIIESGIAVFVKDPFIRGTLGDFFVVILIYCFVQAMLMFNPIKLALGVAAFAYLIEFFQYLNVLDHLNLSNNKLASTVLGNTFSYHDLIAYTLGALFIMVLERTIIRNKRG